MGEVDEEEFIENLSTKQTHRHREQLCVCQGGGGGWDGLGGWSQQMQLLYIEWINNKVLLYSSENYIRYPVINHNGKECEKECISI